MGMRCVVLTGDGTAERPCRLEELRGYADAGAFGWIDLRDPVMSELEELHQLLGLHELAVEDTLNAGQRSKVEHYGDDLVFVVVKDASYEPGGAGLQLSEIHVFVGNDCVVTVSRDMNDLVARVQTEAPRLGLRDPLAVLHAVVDRVVDGHLAALDVIAGEAQALERRVFSRDDMADLAPDIYDLKRDVLELWHDTEPLLDPLTDMVGRLAGANDARAPYFRDVADHLRQVVSRLERMRDLLTDAQDANLARLGVRQNDDMRKMSAWGALFLLPSVLVGLWGMNFQHMPELGQPWGYPAALAVIALSCLALWWRLRRAGWL